MRSFLLLILIMLAATSHSVVAQSGWRTYSPADKSFSVELPETSRIQREKISREERNISYIFGGAKPADLYSLRLRADVSEPSFGVYIFHPAAPLSNKKFDHEVNSNMLWLFGDDKHFSKQADAMINGLHGRDFIFEKGGTSGRAVFANAGRRIYLLVYIREEGGEPTSEIADRIFETFKPTR